MSEKGTGQGDRARCLRTFQFLLTLPDPNLTAARRLASALKVVQMLPPSPPNQQNESVLNYKNKEWTQRAAVHTSVTTSCAGGVTDKP